MSKRIKYSADIERREWEKFSMSEKLEFLRQAHSAMMKTSTSHKKPINLIGDRIAFLRDVYGYSQTKLAKVSGVNRASIIRYESQGTTPSFKNLEAIVLSLCGIAKFVTHYTVESIPQYRTDYLAEQALEEVDIHSDTFDNFKITIHNLFEKHDLYCRYPGGRKYMSQKQRQALIDQIDATLDFAQNMLLQSPVEPYNKKKAK